MVWIDSTRVRLGLLLGIVVLARLAFAQTSNDPFDIPIPPSEGGIVVDVVEFASLPHVDGSAARTMHLVDDPSAEHLFVSDMRGFFYRISGDGKLVTLYLDLRPSARGVHVESASRERGFQSFAVHPQFHQPGTPGFGRLYTWTDTSATWAWSKHG